MTKLRILIFLFLSLFWNKGSSQWSQVSLPAAKIQLGAAVHGNNIFLAGGNNGLAFSPRVDVYNLSNNEWSNLNLSIARALPTGITLNDEIIFAGGYNTVTTSVVDIFDAHTLTRTTYPLSIPRFSMAAAAYNDLVMFAGGANVENLTISNRVDIYHQSDHTWTIDSLSQARAAMAFGVLGNKAYFAGGYLLNNQVSDRIDIYNFESKSWETARLSIPRGFLSAAVAGTKIIFAGGMVANNQASDQVDIYDAATQQWTTSKISAARAFIDNGASICDKAYFVGGCIVDFNNNSVYHPFNVIDIYDPSSGVWSRDSLPQSILSNAVTASADFLISAGGATDIQSPPTYSNTVNIYRCTPSGTTQIRDKAFNVYPNPGSGVFNLEFDYSESDGDISLHVYETNGKMHKIQNIVNGNQIDLSSLPNGMYCLILTNNDRQIQFKKLIMINH